MELDLSLNDKEIRGGEKEGYMAVRARGRKRE